MLLALTFAWMLTGIAAEPAEIAAADQAPVALISGWIDETFSQRLQAFLDHHPQVRSIEIDSPGGYVAQAYQAARLLNRRELGISVRASCASACALLWASVDERALMERGLIGVHAGIPAKQPPAWLEPIVRHINAARELAAFEHARFPVDLIAKARATPHDAMLWLTAGELEAAGVQFERVPSESPTKLVAGRKFAFPLLSEGVAAYVVQAFQVNCKSSSPRRSRACAARLRARGAECAASPPAIFESKYRYTLWAREFAACLMPRPICAGVEVDTDDGCRAVQG